MHSNEESKGFTWKCRSGTSDIFPWPKSMELLTKEPEAAPVGLASINGNAGGMEY